METKLAILAFISGSAAVAFIVSTLVSFGKVLFSQI